MKKSIVFLTLLAMSIVSIPSVFADFTDVVSSHSYSDAISYVETESIVSGYPDGTYKPDTTINRAEFTKIIVGSVYTQEEIDLCTTSPFEDVPTSEWFAPYVCTAEANGIVGGYPDGTFGPANKILIGEAAKIIVTGFGDEVEADEIWFKPYILNLEAKSALPVSLIGFEHNVTRGEMAEMIYRLREEITDKSYTTYDNLENDEPTPALEPEPTPDPEPTNTTLSLNEIGDCEKVKTVDFIVDGEYLVHYGSFAWTGEIVSSTENDITFVRMAVQEDDTAFNFYKDRALARENQAVNRYENDTLYFAIGSLDGTDLFSFANMTEDIKALILSSLDSGEQITLTYAIAFIEGGGAGLEGMTYACAVNN